MAAKEADAIGRPISKDTYLMSMKKMRYGFYKVNFNKHKTSKFDSFFTLGAEANPSLAKTKVNPIFMGKRT